MEGVEVVEAVPRDGGGRQPREGADCGGGGVVTWPPVTSPVRDDLVSGGGWDVAGLLLRDPAAVLLFRLFR